MDNEKFARITNEMLLKEKNRNSIGILSEKNIHAIVKSYYCEDENFHEIPIEGYVADIYNRGEIIEIQNGNFNKIRNKLDAFLPLYNTTIVYPIPYNKWINWIDTKTGEIKEKRKSPKKGSIYDMFYELYKIKKYLEDENLNIDIILLDIMEYRYLDGWDKSKKRGSNRAERIPIGIYKEYNFNIPKDYLLVLPIELEQRFTSLDLSKTAKINIKLAEITLNILTYIKIVKRVGKKERYILYEIIE